MLGPGPLLDHEAFVLELLKRSLAPAAGQPIAEVVSSRDFTTWDNTPSLVFGTTASQREPRKWEVGLSLSLYSDGTDEGWRGATATFDALNSWPATPAGAIGRTRVTTLTHNSVFSRTTEVDIYGKNLVEYVAFITLIICV